MTKDVERIATNIVLKLFQEGYLAYFAGGWVRDFLRGQSTDEIDIATNATPDKIVKIFPKTVPVGIAFGVILVILEGRNFEVSTFRKDHPYLDGRHPDGVDYSNPEEDAKRRDFTINGMFYDPLTQKVYDYVGGQEDLQSGIIRAIGDAEARFDEDRLRMIRAVRFAARFDFEIEKKTELAILRHAETLFPAVSMERIWQEFQKMAAHPRFHHAILDLHRLKLLQTIFPQLMKTSLSTIEKRVAPFPLFPKGTPTILYLMELFPDSTLEEKIALCHYLKTTHADIKLVEFFHKNMPILTADAVEGFTWAHFYAHPKAELLFEIHASHLPTEKRIAFLQQHHARQRELAYYIEGIREHKPLVSAAMLMEKGIEPGVKMGLLLKEAERIAINEKLSDPEAILKKLMKSSLWR